MLTSISAALHYRQVRIYQPTKTTMQSGKAGTDHWRIDFDVLQGGGRWENGLMGWASSADYMQGTTIKFKSKDDAIHFVSLQAWPGVHEFLLIFVVAAQAEKQGWSYQVDEVHQPRIPPKSYSENYVHGEPRSECTKLCHLTDSPLQSRASCGFTRPSRRHHRGGSRCSPQVKMFYVLQLRCPHRPHSTNSSAPAAFHRAWP